MSAQPDVSVLMACYNGLANYPEGMLQEAIESTLAQPGVIVELIVCDDASTDGSALALDEYGGRIRRTAHALRKGAAGSYQTAARAASGEYCILQSVRSWFEPGVLAVMADYLDSHPDIGFVYGETQYHGASTHRHVPPQFDKTAFYSDFVSLHGYMYRREAHERSCAFIPYFEREGLMIDVCDYDFMMQMIHNLGWSGCAIGNLVLHYYYSGQGQMTNYVHRYQREINEVFRARWGGRRGL